MTRLSNCAEYCYAGCRILFIAMLKVVMPSERLEIVPSNRNYPNNYCKLKIRLNQFLIGRNILYC